MEHLVRFKTAEGRDAHHTAESLDEALKFVERLRNSEEVDDVRVYRLTQVPIEFKAYYKVEIRTDGEPVADAGNGAVPAPPLDDAAADANPSLVATPSGEAADDQASGRRLFARG